MRASEITMTRTMRVLILAASALACALLTAGASLGVVQLSIVTQYPGEVLWQYVDWNLILIAAGVTVGCAAVGLACSLVLIWRTDLRFTIPIVAGVTIPVAAAVALAHPLLSPSFGLLAGITTMMVMRRHATIRARRLGILTTG